tara:strand:+ start:213 stop:356 length:144 start_codon:yes stop_codon:yes gene_type:complete
MFADIFSLSGFGASVFVFFGLFSISAILFYYSAKAAFFAALASSSAF